MKIKQMLTAGVLICALSTISAGALSLKINGATETLDGTFVENNTTYVPLRAMAQKLGNVSVEWSNGAAKVTSQSLHLTAKPGNQWIEANGRCFYVPSGVRSANGSVFVPVRALATAMGGSVSWDAARQTVSVKAGSGVPAAATYEADDLYWLSRIISAESRGESLAGKLAVGTVILNRVSNSEFPNSIYDVIFDTKYGVQFTPVSNGTVYDEPTAESIVAAKLVLEGTRVAGASLYFLDPSQASNHWAVYNRTYVTTIGCHQFYA